ncbi:YcxB family protein [Bernardetia sp. ABR2-2B]|uniref:YcxB family protein n=1 Tax=Bernardetia sp. ABR2-2B TaxID=3127472 RepID=UPI0030CCFE91
MNEINFTSQISKKDFIRFNYYSYYRRWSAKLMVLATPFFIYITVLSFLNKVESNYKWFLIFLSSMVIYVPISIYFSSKKAYKNQPILHEQMNYEITDEFITVKGGTFKSTQSWANVISVSETKNLILIWENPKAARLIPKESLNNDQIAILNKIVDLQSHVENKLKK